MDDDGFPNFGNAYTGASPSTPQPSNSASWNPALRPNAEQSQQPETSNKPAATTPDEDDDFFERYPDPTPKKQGAENPVDEESAEEAAWGLEGEADEEAARTESTQNQGISVDDEVLVTEAPAAPEDADMEPHTTADVEAPINHHDHPVEEVVDTMPQNDDAAVFGSDETVEEQAWNLEEHLPEVANDAPPAVQEPEPKGVEQADQASADEEAHRPEENYDYQGEVTEMEEARDESAEAPLMADEQPAPVPGEVSRANTFEPFKNQQVGVETGLEGEAEHFASQPPEPSHMGIERSFTTNFTEPPNKDSETPNPVSRQTIDEDWPAAGDDKTFGELLDDEPQTEQPEEAAAEQQGYFDQQVPAQSTVHEPESDQSVEPQHASVNDNTSTEILEDRTTQAEPREAVDEASSSGQQNVGISDDCWPATADDSSFGDIIGQQSQQEQTRPQESTNDDKPTTENTQTSDDHWPVEEADNTFGELLGHSAQDTTSAQGLGLENVADQPAEEDLSAAFAAALDDDDILDDNEIDPAALFGDDDDGLLDDDDDDFLGEAQNEPLAQMQQQSTAKASYTPNPAVQHPFQQPTISTPGTPFIEQNMARSAGTPSTGLFDVHSQPVPSQEPQRPTATTAKSFVDKAKGGYQSPYDLPMEVVKPRRRPQQTPQMQSSAQMPAPPPRTSSFHQPSQTPGSAMTPPISNNANAPTAPPPAAGATPPVLPQGTPKSADSGFFADLPVAPKLRARPSGVFTPQTVGTPTPPLPPQAGFPPQQRPPQGAAVPPPTRPMGPPTPAQQPAIAGSLTQPVNQPLFPEQSAPQVPPSQQFSPAPATNDRYSPSVQAAPAAPPAPSRYSPAPAPSAQASTTASRYSPAPAAQPQTQPSQRYSSAPQPSSAPVASRPPQVQPFAPRTSSPLAMHGRPKRQNTQDSVPITPISPPTANGLLSPERRGSTGMNYMSPPSGAGRVEDSGFGAPLPGPPQRPRTQSPGAVMKSAKTAAAFTGAAAAPGHAASPLAPAVPKPAASQPTASHQRPVKLAHRRQFSRDLAFAAPQDERSQDPLERWKGHPIFTWSASGTVVHSFPKQSAFYAAGHGIPSIKCTPGMITMEDATTFLPLAERDAKFPGPLPARSKGKKKELLSWMSGKIEDLERETEGVLLDFNLPTDVQKGTEEKLVLWKIMKIFVEHDGVLEGTPQIDEEVRRVLLPNLAQMSQVADLQSPGASVAQPDPVDTSVLAQLRQALFEGQRERAVWIAEEKKLWGHALLLASTMGPEMWKQIVASFVRSQVRTSGADARSLAALYQVFAGSAEDCVDELVPPSARAGFLMMSKTDGSRAGNPLEGLDQWRETLALVTSNRTPTDTHSLVALAKLLSSYGRSEAAHTCCLFARQLAKHSGADDSEASFVLLGANHSAGDANLDSIMLTEIFEYASSLSTPSSTASYIPHLQAYKLMHGQQLAAYGLKQKAESYCSHIDSAIRSTTKPSGYYNQALAQELISFNAFLSQTPQTAGSGGKFFSKPAMDKVSSGVGSWFTKFVAGDDGETDPVSSAGQGAAAAASSPFGAVDTNQSTISRTNSTTELYNPMMASAPLQPAFQPASTPAAAPSRYAPGGAASVPAQPAASGNRYAPSVSSQFAPSRSSMDSDRSYEPQIPNGLGMMPASDSSRPSSSRYNSYAPQSHLQQSPNMLGVPRPEVERSTSDHLAAYNGGSRRSSAMSHVSNQSYEPKPMFADDGFGAPPHQQQEAEPPADDAEGGFSASAQPHGDEPHGFDAETAGSGYQPPSSGYEPPAYQPYQPEPEPEEQEEEAPKPKLKPMMDDDDDDDIMARAAALKSSTPSSKPSTAAADAQADAAFRAAAEADAARSQSDKDNKKGWFGGWFGGAKKDQPPGSGPVRAKLGEQSSFYFDKDLNKWVNKKAGASESTTPAAATPPPPKGPPSRVASGPPTMGPPSRAASGSGLSSAGSRPPTSSGPVPVAGGPPSNPPSRTGTPASLAGSPALPSALNGPGAAGNLMPPPRPSSSLSNASSLDDLLSGPPGGGKKGTVKGGKKKGGRYVDVMAGK